MDDTINLTPRGRRETQEPAEGAGGGTSQLLGEALRWSALAQSHMQRALRGVDAREEVSRRRNRSGQ